MLHYKNNLRKNKPAGLSVWYRVLLIFCVLLFGIAFVCFRLRGGIQIKPQHGSDVQSGAEMVLYRQDDERWGDDRLGDSKYTLGSSGCLVSCIASAVSMECGEKETPAALNAEFSAAGAYDGEGNLQWEVLSEDGTYQVDIWSEVSPDRIDTCLLEGRYPVVRVRVYGLGNIHYVLIVGVKDGEYLCMDPLQDELTKLSRYGNRVYAVRCVSLKEEKLQDEESQDDIGSDGAESAENTECAKVQAPAVSERIDTLPFDEEMEMTFCSGAGVWMTVLRLKPDGSFSGDYHDSDMGVIGTDYPNDTRYVCKFHGRFGEMAKISDASFSLTLKELVIDTGHPVGEEWIEDGVRCVSSEPYGLDGAEGKALHPGAVFLFYTPQATGYKAGTELYGALEFCSWWPVRGEFLTEDDRLGCYGLHNLEMGYGFFSDEIGE